MEQRAKFNLLVFVLGFATVWLMSVVCVWKLGWLSEPLRPWYRTAVWCGAALFWVRWQRTPKPLHWIGLAPVSLAAALASIAAITILIGWNEVRIVLLDNRHGELSNQTLATIGWSFVSVFVEELLFRGVIQTRLSEMWPHCSAIGLTSLLFLLIHVPGWVLLKVPVTPMLLVSVASVGLICGALRHWTQSLWPAIAAHWANNIGALF